MDPLIIHHVIRHPLSRNYTNDFQDKSGCSINGFRAFLFEQGIVQNFHDVERLVNNFGTFQDYRGCPIILRINDFKNFPVSDEILRMKNVRFIFDVRPPNHKLVSPEPHFVEEERNLIENHFSYMGSSYNIEEWDYFEMDNEGHLVSIFHDFVNFQFSNESIEHLSNFPHLRNLKIWSSTNIQESVTNFGLLSNLINLSIHFERAFEDPELFQDLGLFSNLLYLDLRSNNGFLKLQNL